MCAKGHNDGTHRDGRCRTCAAEAARRYRIRRRVDGPTLRNITLPTEPLRAWMESHDEHIFTRYGWHSNFERAAYRPRVSVDMADRLAIALGVHPFEIWGEAFYTGCDEVSA